MSQILEPLFFPTYFTASFLSQFSSGKLTQAHTSGFSYQTKIYETCATKCSSAKLCRNCCLEAFSHAKKQCALFRYKKVSVKKTSFFTMCHYSEFHQITYVNCRRNDLQNDVNFSLSKCFLATQETLQNSTRKT